MTLTDKEKLKKQRAYYEKNREKISARQKKLPFYLQGIKIECPILCLEKHDVTITVT